MHRMGLECGYIENEERCDFRQHTSQSPKVERPKTTNLRNSGHVWGYMVGDIFFPCRKIVFPKNAYFSIFLFSILNFLQFFKAKSALDPIIDL